MESQAPLTHLRPYMRKGHSIKVDIVTRQAMVTPIFRKPSVPPISEKCVKVYDPLENNMESQDDEGYLIESKLYDKYRTMFNSISKESLLNNMNKDSLYDDISSESSAQSSDTLLSKRMRFDKDFDYKIYDKKMKSDEFLYRPWISILPSIVRSLSGTKDSNHFSFNGSTMNKFDCFKSSDEIIVDGSETMIHLINDKHVRKLTLALNSFVKEMDDWNYKARNALSKTGSERIMMDEARELLEHYHFFTCGFFMSELAERVEVEIKKCEEYILFYNNKLDHIFQNDEAIDIGIVECLLREGLKTTFITPEYLSLNHLFYTVSSLRNMLDESVLSHDISNSSMLIKECDNSVIKVPNLESLKNQVSKLTWLSNAQRFSQKPVNYILVKDLIDNTPEELKTHTLYILLKEKLDMSVSLVEELNHPKFNNIMIIETVKTNEQNDSTAEPDVQSSEEVEVLERIKPEELESVYNRYHEINLIIPAFKNVEPLHHMWKRFQRRLKRIENLISSENTMNCTIECLVLLQHAENIIKYMEIDELLEPIKKDVEVSLNFEKKCRNLINIFNNYSITNDFIKFRTDWNSLINFRKNVNVNTNDLIDTINLINTYNELYYNDLVDDKCNRIEFNDLNNIKLEFNGLKVKNWQIYRNLEEIYNSGMELTVRVDDILNQLKAGIKSDEIVSNLILITIESLKFGANLKLEEKLLKALKYCLWVKKLYSLISKLHQTVTLKRDDIDFDKYIVLLKNLTNANETQLFHDYIDNTSTIGSNIKGSDVECEELKETDGSVLNLIKSFQIFKLTELDLIKLFTT